MNYIVHSLLPYFAGVTSDMEHARAEILATLQDYCARTRVEMLLAAKMLMFGMATLDTLSRTRAAEMSPSMYLRHLACANALNRSEQQNTKVLDRRLAEDVPRPMVETTDLIADISEADVETTMAATQATIDALRERAGQNISSSVTVSPMPAAHLSAITQCLTPEQQHAAHNMAAALMNRLLQPDMPLPLPEQPIIPTAPFAQIAGERDALGLESALQINR